MELQEFDDRATTPITRPDYENSDSTLDQWAKERVVKASPNGYRCLVTNTELSLNFCHCIARFTLKRAETVRIYRIYHYYSGIKCIS
jgi:hypothetical protein